jgi:hypothetical protein|tara:strand:- start:1933 stop:2568 length:636 start_codon:yes stop_codon:yes gene_type:complete
MTAEIKQTLLRTVCGGWDRNFLESVLEQISKGRELSVKQKDILAKVLGRNGEANQVIHDNWSTEYEKGYKTHAKVLAEYHSLQPYYREMAKDILNDHVPERVKFLRMFNNKYSKKIITEYQKEPKYSAGDFVSPRASFVGFKNAEAARSFAHPAVRKAVERFMRTGGFIIEIKKEIYSHAKGAKRYRILPIGETIPLIVEERFIKLNRHKA